MGDFKATIKISMELVGKRYKQEFWVNYVPSSCCGVDERVAEWLKSCYNDAYTRYYVKIEKQQEGAKKAELEQEEREMLAALKAKYE